MSRFSEGEIVSEIDYTPGAPMWTKPPHLWRCVGGGSFEPLCGLTDAGLLLSVPVSSEMYWSKIDPLLAQLILLKFKEQSQ